MKTININFKRFGKDVILNFVASIAIVGTLQLFVYPLLSKNFGATVFGAILALMGIVNTVALTVGGALDNIRLITYHDYKDRNIHGDFKSIIEYSSTFSIIVTIIITLFFIKQINLIDIILLAIVTLLTLMRAYLSVEYRLRVNYSLIFWYNSSACIGYIIGSFFSLWTGIWQITFISGEIFACLFALLTTEYLKESRQKTELFNSTLTKFIQLAVSTIIANTLIYLDRFIIYPIMGAKYVAVFFAASMFGKIVSMVFQPISSVLLTYFAQSKKRIKLKDFWRYNLIILALSVIFYLICLMLAPKITGILYPNLITEAKKFLAIANLAAIISTIGALTQPILLRFSSTHWQLVLQIVYGISYILFGIIFLKMYGLFGFCIAALLSSVLRLIIMWIVGNYSLKSN